MKHDVPSVPARPVEVLPRETPPPSATLPPLEIGSFLGRPRRVGLAVIAAFVAVFGIWGSLAPLAGGAVAPGRVSPESGVKTVQHLEGGIVSALHVAEGDRVAASSPLLELQHVGTKAEVEALRDRRAMLLAEAARLEAELLGRSEIDFPATLDRSEPGVRLAIAAQTRLFETRRDLLATRERILEQRREQLQQRIGGLEAQAASAREQHGLIAEELGDKTHLLGKGLMQKNEVLRMRRAAADLAGQRGAHLAEIAAASQRIGETRLEGIALTEERFEAAAARAAEVQGELITVEQSLTARSDVLARTVVAAPVAGVVANLRIKTLGGVIAPGEPILDIVPSEARLLIDAEIAPSDIDAVAEGMDAVVTLTAFSGRALPRITGRLTQISADTISDEQTGREFYRGRVEVPAEALRASGEALSLLPGMPADVLIVTSQRTFVGYLLQPLQDILRRGLRET